MKIKLKTAVREVPIYTPFIRLDECLKFAAAVLSGGQAKEAVQQGLVLVNGEVCTMRGKKLVPGDRVGFAGKLYEVTRK